MKAFFAVFTLMLLSGCTQSIPAQYETKLSNLFNVCVQAPRGAEVYQQTPADVEQISYKDAHASYEITLSHHHGDRSRFKGHMVVLRGPLDVLVLGTLPPEVGGAYVISFDSAGAVQPRGFGSIAIKSGSRASVDDMFTFLASWHRCGQSP